MRPSEAPLADRIRAVVASLSGQHPAARAEVPTGPPMTPERLEVSSASVAPAPDPIASYKATLEALWTISVQGGDAHSAEIKRLLAAQARQCDDLGPEFAAAVARHARREWAERERRCSTSGMAGLCHDPELGEAIPLEPAPGSRDASGWRTTLPALGERRPYPLTPCGRCGYGTFAVYGDTPLCRPCSDAWGTG